MIYLLKMNKIMILTMEIKMYYKIIKTKIIIGKAKIIQKHR